MGACRCRSASREVAFLQAPALHAASIIHLHFQSFIHSNVFARLPREKAVRETRATTSQSVEETRERMKFKPRNTLTDVHLG